MPTQATPEIVWKFGQVVGVQKAETLVEAAADAADISEVEPYSADDIIQICRHIETEQSGVISNVAREIRVRTQMEQRFEKLFSLIPDPAMIVTQEAGAVTVWNVNDAAENSLNISLDESESADLDHALNTPDDENLSGKVRQQIPTDDQQHLQTTIEGEDTRQHFLVRVWPVETDLLSGTPNGTVGNVTKATQQAILYFTNITEQEKRQRRIERHREAMGVINRVLRHNLRNEMTIILSSVLRLDTHLDDSDEARQALDMIQRSAEDLVEIGNKGRKITDAVENVEQKEIDIVRITTETVEKMKKRYEYAEIYIDVPDRAVAVADWHLDWALENLLDNAISHNDKEPPVVEVRVEKRSAPGDVLVTIADNGPGVPEHEISVLDQDSETPLKHGTGLGLWLVAWVVEQYGGDIDFAERQPDGMSVSIRLQNPSDTQD